MLTKPTTALTMLVALASIFVLLHKAILARTRDLFDLYSFNGDSLQHIASLWLLRNPYLEGNDYILTYYWNAILPGLFKWMYSLMLLVCSPILAAKIVTFVLSVGFIALLAATSRRIAGPYASYLTALFATGGVIKNIYFMGGIQRGFGIFLAACALYALSVGRVATLAALCIVAASLYPAASVFLLITLAVTLALPANVRGSAAQWSWAKRLLYLAGCALICVLIVTPQILGGMRYGDRLSIENEVEFPEWSSSGRYTDGDRGVPVKLFTRTLQVVTSGLAAGRAREGNATSDETSNTDVDRFDVNPSTQSMIIILLTLLSSVFCFYRTSWRISATTTRCLTFPLAAAISFGCATVLFPLLYIPSRYIALGVIPLVPIVFPCIWATTVATFFERATIRAIATTSVGLGLFLWLGWSDVSIRHLPSAAGHRPLIRFVKSLPENVVITGWPRGVLNMVPLYTGRSVLLFEEGHQVFHREFTEEARARMRAITALYSSGDRGAVDLLQQRYGVTHILFDTRHIEKRPTYFEPFNSEIQRARDAQGDRPLHIAQLAKSNVVFSHGPFVIIDLRK